MTKEEFLESVRCATKITAEGKVYYADEYGMIGLPEGRYQVTYFVEFIDTKGKIEQIQRTFFVSSKERARVELDDVTFFVGEKRRIKLAMYWELVNRFGSLDKLEFS